MKKLTLMWVLLIAGTLSACNTTRGFGEDVEATGDGIQDAAERTERRLEDAVN